MSSPEQLTNRAGVVVFDGTAAPGGGSQPGAIRRVSADIAFNTPNLDTTGVVLKESSGADYVPQAGDIVGFFGGQSGISGGLSLPAFWTNGGVTLAKMSLSVGSSELANLSLDDSGAEDDPTTLAPLVILSATVGNQSEPLVCSDATPFVVTVTDGAGGPNDATSGTASVYMFVCTP